MKLKKGMSGLGLGRFVCIGCLALTACGGGGTAPAPSPTNSPPTNSAPSFTSASTVTVTENNSGSFYTAVASDPDGDPLTFAISGGADASAFSLSGQNLSFAQSPNFERPADADRDNTYAITLQVSDGRGGSTSLGVSVNVDNDKEGIAVIQVATGFVDPTGLGFLLSLGPSGFEERGRIAVAQKNGEIFDVDGTTGARTLLADVFENRPRGELLAIGFNDRRNNFYSGLYAVAREPNGRVFVQRYTRTPITELELLPTGSAPVSATIFEGVDRSLPGGDLFMTLSDEGGTFAQDITSLRGKLIFLQERDPFAGASVRAGGYDPIVIGTGIRRSGGAGPVNGEILLSDQGGSIEHELNFFPQDARPLDFGWPGREGTQGIGANPPPAVIGPTIAYGFGTGDDQGEGVVFGGLYTGNAADLANSFVFGDISGTIWSVPFADLTSGFLLRPEQMDRRTEDFVPDTGNIDSPVAFIVDDMDRLFILDTDGELYRVDAT